MLNSEQTLCAFENILSITQQMLQSAKLSNSNNLHTFELKLLEQTECIKKAGGVVNLSGDDRFKKVELLQQILANDRDTRCITEPWLNDVHDYIHNVKLQSRIDMSSTQK